MKFLGKLVDERFLAHRRRSTSVAGVTGGVLAILLPVSARAIAPP